jgi:hypothetical protein
MIDNEFQTLKANSFAKVEVNTVWCFPLVMTMGFGE